MRFALNPKRTWLRVLLALGALLLVIIVTLIGSTAWLDALGGTPRGDRLARMQRSPNYRDGRFRNTEPTDLALKGGVGKMLRQWLLGREQRTPPGPMPIVTLTGAAFAEPPASGLRATWLGHATVLVEIDGARILTDPVWARRASPSSLVGPRRFHAPPLAIEDLPPLDAILASHDHYDHLDRGVVRAIVASATQQHVRWVVPLGVGAHLEAWGVAADRITELDWHDSTTVGALTITATPARHFSGRAFSRDHTLWASFAIAGPRHRVFHSGDTGPFAGFADIGAAHGPFDLTFIKIGAYGDGWPDIHLNPEQAIAAHAALRGDLLLPIHWGTFNLAYHVWDEPAERVVAAALANGARVVMPRPGESIEPAAAPPVSPWWRSVRAP